MGLGPIPYSAIRSYADEHDIVSRDDFDYFFKIIQGMDSEYLAITNKAEKGDKDMISISDVEGQHAMFARLKARAGNAPKNAPKRMAKK